MNKIQKDLDELMAAGVIDGNTAGAINTYYAQKASPSGSRLLAAFSILGGIITSLGIILLIAHNWEEFGKTIQSILAFLPLLIGQAACFILLWKHPEKNVWKEVAAVFLFFAIPASVALISQIYNVQGDLEGFLLTWLLLSLPLIYLMKSPATSLLFILCATWYGVVSDWDRDKTYYVWLFLLAALPHYLLLLRTHIKSNFTVLHNWLYPLALFALIPSIPEQTGDFLALEILGLFNIYLLVSEIPPFSRFEVFRNGFAVTGALGSLITILILTFPWPWRGMNNEAFPYLLIPEVIIYLVLLALIYLKDKVFPKNPIFYSLPVFLIAVAGLSVNYYVPVLISNLFLLTGGIWLIILGAKRDHLGIMNTGLVLIAALAACRFFDETLSFLVRGGLFLLTGVAFFYLNFRMVRNRSGKIQRHEN